VSRRFEIVAAVACLLVTVVAASFGAWVLAITFALIGALSAYPVRRELDDKVPQAAQGDAREDPDDHPARRAARTNGGRKRAQERSGR
jgi:uncharacterized membrane protein